MQSAVTINREKLHRSARCESAKSLGYSIDFLAGNLLEFFFFFCIGRIIGGVERFDVD